MQDLSQNVTDREEKAAAAAWAKEYFTLNALNGVYADTEYGDAETDDRCVLSWPNISNAWFSKSVWTYTKDWFEDVDNDVPEAQAGEDAKPIAKEPVGLTGVSLGAWKNALTTAAVERTAVSKWWALL